MNQAEKNLCNFIENVYPARGIPFSTSWSSYSICSTEEEVLLSDVFAPNGDENRDWYVDLPPKLIDLAHENDAYDREVLDTYEQFLADAMGDLFACHVREM